MTSFGSRSLAGAGTGMGTVLACKYHVSNMHAILYYTRQMLGASWGEPERVAT